MSPDTPETPGYRQLADRLRDLIADLPDGARLPTVRKISDDYGVTKSAAARAITVLAQEGRVVARRGAGTVVVGFAAIPRSSPGRLGRDRWAGGYAIQDQETAGRLRVDDVRTGEGAPPDWAAGPLGITDGDPAVFRSRRYLVDDRPVQLATSWLRVEVARGTRLMYTDTGPGGSYARLAELGHAPVRFREWLRARMPASGEVAALILPAGCPVVEITRHAYEADGAVVEVNRMVLDGMAYLLDYAFDA
jgi:GntR family transcriptional regulator